MRKVACCLLIACAAGFGQNAPEAPAQNPTVNPAPNNADSGAAPSKALSEAVRRSIERMTLVNPQNPIRLQALPAIKPSVCATPLLRVIPPPNTDKMPIQQTPERRKGEVAQLPAPPCDDTAYTKLRIAPVNPVPVIPPAAVSPAPKQ